VLPPFLIPRCSPAVQDRKDHGSNHGPKTIVGTSAASWKQIISSNIYLKVIYFRRELDRGLKAESERV
jgi:hypothetical protein